MLKDSDCFRLCLKREDCHDDDGSLPHEECCCERFANVYSSISHIVGAHGTPSDFVKFDKQNWVSPGDFDLSAANSLGEIKFQKHGIYRLSWILQARITAPVPVPVPSWSFAFWLNGVLVPGSLYSGYTQSPNDDAAHSTGEVMVEVKAGDILKLRNTSISSVNLNPSVTGAVFPITIATVMVQCLKSLP